MVDYSVITNEKLRTLVMSSSSIQSQNDEAIFAMVQQIVSLPSEGQQDLIAALEEEKTLNDKVVFEEATKQLQQQQQQAENIYQDFKKEKQKILDDRQKREAAKADSLLQNIS